MKIKDKDFNLESFLPDKIFGANKTVENCRGSYSYRIIYKADFFKVVVCKSDILDNFLTCDFSIKEYTHGLSHKKTIIVNDNDNVIEEIVKTLAFLLKTEYNRLLFEIKFYKNLINPSEEIIADLKIIEKNIEKFPDISKYLVLL